jgi:Permease family
MTELALRLHHSRLVRRFAFEEHRTNLGRDTVAGATTFIVMSYIIFVNPSILSFAGVESLQGKGLPFDAVLSSTCLVAGVMTILMGLHANRAYALAPGLGFNAVVAFTLVANEGLGFPEAMGLVVLEGAVVTLLVLTGFREQVMNAIPLELKKATPSASACSSPSSPLQLGHRHEGGRRAGGARPLHHMADLRHALRAGAHARPPRARLQGRPARRNHRHDDPRHSHQLGDGGTRRSQRPASRAGRATSSKPPTSAWSGP